MTANLNDPGTWELYSHRDPICPACGTIVARPLAHVEWHTNLAKISKSARAADAFTQPLGQKLDASASFLPPTLNIPELGRALKRAEAVACDTCGGTGKVERDTPFGTVVPLPCPDCEPKR